MLKDLKSFVVGSNVAEVGVGLSVGATFTALVTAVVAFAKDGIHGEWAFAGISTAAIALVTVLLVSTVGVIKPLMKLRARMGGGEQAEATSDATTDGGTASASATASERAVTDEEAAPTAAAETAEEAAADVVAVEVAEEAAPAPVAAFAADPLHAPLPVQVAGSATAGGPSSVVLGATAAAAAAGAVTANGEADVAMDAQADTPVEAAVVDLTAPAPAAAPDDAVVPVDGTAAAAPQPVAPAVPAGAVPFRATELTACPHCAFDVPAAATRCGWCTSDLRVAAAV